MKNGKFIIITSIFGIISIIVLLIGITYAYYNAPINTYTPASYELQTTSELKVTYTADTSGVSCNKCTPGWSDYVKFSVYNPKGTKAAYNVVWANFTNNFTRQSDLTYTLTCTSTSGTCNGISGQLPSTSSSVRNIISNITISPGVKHTYTLTVKYENLSGTNQSADKGKTFSGKISITAANVSY